MKLQRSVLYSTQVWLTSVVAGPPLAFLLQWIGSADHGLQPMELLSYYLLHLVYGGIFSIPNWLLLMFGVGVVNQLEHWSEPARRLLIQLWAFVLTVGIFMWFFQGDMGVSTTFGLYLFSYTAALSLGIWNFKLSDVAQDAVKES